MFRATFPSWNLPRGAEKRYSFVWITKQNEDTFLCCNVAAKLYVHYLLSLDIYLKLLASHNVLNSVFLDIAQENLQGEVLKVFKRYWG